MVGRQKLEMAMLRYGQPEDCGAIQQQDRHREEHQVVSTARQLARQEQDMREEYFCKAAARQTLFCAVWIVALVALVAWLV